MVKFYRIVCYTRRLVDKRHCVGRKFSAFRLSRSFGFPGLSTVKNFSKKKLWTSFSVGCFSSLWNLIQIVMNKIPKLLNFELKYKHCIESCQTFFQTSDIQAAHVICCFAICGFGYLQTRKQGKTANNEGKIQF